MKTSTALGTLLFLFVVLVLTACEKPASEAPVTSEPEEPKPQTQPLSSFDPQIDEILAQMTLEEKVGQMTQPDMSYLEDEADIRDYHLGSVLSGGGSDPTPENTFDDWRDLYNRYQAYALETRLGIPLLYGIDAVHGHSNVVGAVIFPHNIGLGATRNADLVQKVYQATAIEVRATGINWDFAPCVTVPLDERWGRTYEGFGEEPGLVTELGEAAIRGLQGQGLGDPLGVLACAKHFVGDGATVYGTGMPKEDEDGNWPMDRGDMQVTEEELRKTSLPPYFAAIEAGVGSIMPSFSSWNGVKCSGSKELLTDMLKDEMGFEGFLISDWAAIDEIPGDYKSDIEISINAGMDMVMVPDKYKEFFNTLKELVEEGKVPMERIDDAVRRILRVKFAMGLMDKDRSHLADEALAARFGTDEHRALARDAVRQSLVLLKNEGTLPLSKDVGRIHVAGKNADDLGHQCGGWTIEWQGASGDITEGTTVLAGIREAVAEGTEVTYSKDGSGAEGADVAVVVIGEAPYAEMEGDRDDLALDAEDIATVAKVAETGVPTVVILISGRPMILGDTLDQSSALIAAWLPGTEGQGVSDVLFGDHAPTGKLSFSWPRSMDQLPINIGDEDYDPLFEYGFGLAY